MSRTSPSDLALSLADACGLVCVWLRFSPPLAPWGGDLLQALTLRVPCYAEVLGWGGGGEQRMCRPPLHSSCCGRSCQPGSNPTVPWHPSACGAARALAGLGLCPGLGSTSAALSPSLAVSDRDRNLLVYMYLPEGER